MTALQDALRRARGRAMFPKPFSDFSQLPPKLLLPNTDTFVVDDVAEEIAREEQQRADAVYRRAIAETDWDETAVVRVIERHPLPAVGKQPGDFSVEGSAFEIERYADRAPPLSGHADGERRCSVATITRPLLERLAEDSEEIADLLEVIDDGDS